jgi:membrane associated rhomboid family serine protease
LLWLFGRPANHIGASGLIFGLIAFLIVSGLLERRFVPLVISVVVIFFYGGSLLLGVVPRLGSHVSWDGHLFGAVAGGIIAYVLTRYTKPQEQTI